MSAVARTIHERNGRQAPPANALALVDAHHHLWDLRTHRYPWLQDSVDDDFFLGDYAAIRRDYLAEDYLRDSARQRVLATVHCEAEHTRDDQVEETRWLHEQHARHGFPNAVVAHVWFHRPDCEEILCRHLEYPLVRGIRSKPVTSRRPGESVREKAGTMQDDAWLGGFSLLEKYGLSWDLRVPYWHLGEAAEVARMFPKVPIVLNHTGFPWDRSEAGLAAWRRSMEALAEQPNAHVKISELGLKDAAWSVAGNRRVVLDAIAIFGIERCMFASNFPVAGLRASYDTIASGLQTLLGNYAAATREAFFWRNATAFYRIALE